MSRGRSSGSSKAATDNEQGELEAVSQDRAEDGFPSTRLSLFILKYTKTNTDKPDIWPYLNLTHFY